MTKVGEKDCSRIVSDKRNDQGLENQINTSGYESSRSRNECNDKSTSRDATNIKSSYDTEPMVEIQNRLKWLKERKLQIQEYMVQKVKASNASSGEKDCSRIVSDKRNDQGLENQINTSGYESSRSRNECNDKSTSRDATNIKSSYDTEPMVE
nr:hypothetical protein [Tanacetum cinerariifolium]